MGWIDSSKCVGLTEMQRSELTKATSGNRVGILTGIPGAGKTYTLAAMLRELNSNSVMIMAPTGKAAVRASEAMQENGLKHHATTIHRALEPTLNGHGDGNWGFLRGKWNQFEAKWIVVDECSMIPTRLMSHLLSAVADQSRVLLIGDPDQLPPIGAGRPFLDMIDAGIPTGTLSDPHRYSGRIGTVCKAIRDGSPFAPSPEIDLELEYPENYRHIERSTAPYQVFTALKVIDRVRDRGFDPIQDVQVLVATNDKSPVSRKQLNTALREHINSEENRREHCPFWMGDKVICLKNGLRNGNLDDREKASWTASYVANGEQGVICGIEPNIGNGSDFKPRWVAVRFDDNRECRFWRGEWRDLDLGYAITTHKAQGSGFPVVIYMIDDSGAAKRVCSRSHVYTAMSRPRKLLFTIGKKSVLDAHIRKVDLVKRKTFLVERIRGQWTHNCTFFPMKSS